MNKTRIALLAAMVVFIPATVFGAQMDDSPTKSPFLPFTAISGPANAAGMEHAEADIALIRY